MMCGHNEEIEKPPYDPELKLTDEQLVEVRAQLAKRRKPKPEATPVEEPEDD